jgi:hypothetical protein
MDWEFTDIGAIGINCLPISVGLVSLGDESIYLEFADFGPCSDFVTEHVLPHLSLRNKVNHREAASRVLSWLSQQGSRIVLTADSDYDWRMLLWVVPELCQYLQVRFVHILEEPSLQQFELADGARGRIVRDIDDGMAAWYMRHQRPRHQALNDARALRAAWLSVSGSEPT